MFRLLFVLSTIAAIAYGFSVPAVKLLDNRIVGGVGVSIDQYPYQISLRLVPGDSSRHICGGSIYTNKVIITAAHCVYESSISQLVVVAGVTFRTQIAPILTIQRIIVHGQYNSASINNDIALVILTLPLIYTTNIQPISLAENNPAVGVLATVTGWGTLSEGGSIPNQLQAVDVPIVSRTTCSAAYGSSAITDTMICAGYTSGGRDACQGDSGGPLAVGNVLVGIVSWGYGCARPNYPGVYASVAVLRPWIIQNSSGL